MFGKNEISDKVLLKDINKRLSRTGIGSQSSVRATVQRGAVTLSGRLQYEIQRMRLVKAMQGVAGVRQVIDHMQAPLKKVHGT